MWNELTIAWNETTFWWNEIILTYFDLERIALERNDHGTKRR